jgi:TRAP-type mannitol/chloroaromatic compound transport system, small permease component
VHWLFGNLLEGLFNIFYALATIPSWLGWVAWHNTLEDKQALMRFIYYGGSVELFFSVAVIVLIVTPVGMWRHWVMWACVRGLESFANGVGRFFAWAGLMMVAQQILMLFMQRIFAVSEIGIGVGSIFTQDVSWWSESLKVHNPMIVAMWASYTLVQGGHLRLYTFYSAVSERGKRGIDLFGSLHFMLPAVEAPLDV